MLETDDAGNEHLKNYLDGDLSPERPEVIAVGLDVGNDFFDHAVSTGSERLATGLKLSASGAAEIDTYGKRKTMLREFLSRRRPATSTIVRFGLRSLDALITQVMYVFSRVSCQQHVVLGPTAG